MSISDVLMWRYLDLLSFEPTSILKRWRADVEQGLNPRDVKFRLGQEIVSRFHGVKAGEAAVAAFVARFQQGALPDVIPEHHLAAQSGKMPIANILKEAGLVSSTSEALRLIRQGGVRIDGNKAEDPALEIPAGKTHLFQVGKRKFARVSIR